MPKGSHQVKKFETFLKFKVHTGSSKFYSIAIVLQILYIAKCSNFAQKINEEVRHRGGWYIDPKYFQQT